MAVKLTPPGVIIGSLAPAISVPLYFLFHTVSSKGSTHKFPDNLADNTEGETPSSKVSCEFSSSCLRGVPLVAEHPLLGQIGQ